MVFEYGKKEEEEKKIITIYRYNDGLKWKFAIIQTNQTEIDKKKFQLEWKQQHKMNCDCDFKMTEVKQKKKKRQCWLVFIYTTI